MAELLTPYYRITARGPNETGFALLLRIEEGAGGPLEGRTMDSVVAEIRALLQGGDDQIATAMVLTETTTTSL